MIETYQDGLPGECCCEEGSGEASGEEGSTPSVPIPCGACDFSIGQEMTLTLNNVTVTGSCCSDWIGAWVLHQLTQDELTYTGLTWPNTYEAEGGGGFGPNFLLTGCTFGLFDGLPCGATSLILALQSISEGILTIGFADGQWISWNINPTPAGPTGAGDCCAVWAISSTFTSGGFTQGTVTPLPTSMCDWPWFPFDFPGYFTLVMNC